MTRKEQLLKALGYFKDWSNYLLVTTVAALGWVSSKDAVLPGEWRTIIMVLFALSVVFAILTLALIPLVAEAITDESTSIYDVRGSFKLFWLWGREYKAPLKAACWPQHILFIFGVMAYALAFICE
jgi:hypothetical protein